jgi:uncharacterized membrane protein
VTLLALLLSITLGIGSLAWGYTLVGLPEFARWILIFGVAWLFAVWQRWRWFAYAGVTFNFLAAALGLWFLNFPPGWMFAGAIGGLLAWDLTSFLYRQRFVASDEERRAMEKRHLFRISFLALLGFGLASAAMVLKLQFNFEWALLSAVVAALGITQIVIWFRKRGG